MDKSMMGDLDSLPEQDKLRFSAMIDNIQMRDRGLWKNHTYNYTGLRPALVMTTIAWDPSSRVCQSEQRSSLNKQEETCVQRCAEKFLKHSMRVGMRFAELNQGNATSD